MEPNMIPDMTTFYARDAVNLAEAGYMLGDAPLMGCAPGERGERLIAAAASGELRTTGGPASRLTLVTRKDLGRYLVKYGSESDRRTRAMTWASSTTAATMAAHGIDRVAAGVSFRAEPGLDRSLWPATFAAGVRFAAMTNADRQFDGTAYAGGVVTDHPLFPRVAFDLASTTFKTPAPALLDHGAPVGVVERADVRGDIKISGKLFASSDPIALSIARKADGGMPWQLSVRIYPGTIDKIKPGAPVMLNGTMHTGPLEVFRNNRIREVSFCALGADDRTSVRIAG